MTPLDNPTYGLSMFNYNQWAKNVKTRSKVKKKCKVKQR